MKFVGRVTKFNGNVQFYFKLCKTTIEEAAKRIQTELKLIQTNNPEIRQAGVCGSASYNASETGGGNMSLDVLISVE